MEVIKNVTSPTNIERKITTKGHVYGSVAGTNLFLLRWVITSEQVNIITELQQPEQPKSRITEVEVEGQTRFKVSKDYSF
jgi:hypothetical protein